MKKKIWIASFVKNERDEEGNLISVFKTPFYLHGSLNSLSGETEMQVYGEKINRMCKTVLPYRYINDIKEKDVAYLYGVTPDEEILPGDNANYRVTTVRPQNIKVIVYFEKLGADECHE